MPEQVAPEHAEPEHAASERPASEQDPPACPRPGRLPLAAAAAAVTVVGLLVATNGSGPVADAAGDALYAVLVYLVLATCLPGARRTVLMVTAFALCALVELAQLTGVPAALVEMWGPVRYLLGTTFNAVDLLAYGAGALAGAGIHRALTTTRTTRTTRIVAQERR